jgi:hypothetical protein
MALNAGNQEATEGMSKAIYDKLCEVIEPDLAGLKAEDIMKIREGWQKLAYAIANGVVSHLKAEMEISGVTVLGNIHASVDGNTKPAAPDANHIHSIDLTAVMDNVIFTQNNDGKGRVK